MAKKKYRRNPVSGDDMVDIGELLLIAGGIWLVYEFVTNYLPNAANAAANAINPTNPTTVPGAVVSSLSNPVSSAISELFSSPEEDQANTLNPVTTGGATGWW
jgi:hypothetical protein